MSFLFASNNAADWSGTFLTDTSGTYHDATRVPYAFDFDSSNISKSASLRSFHPPASGDTTWYRFEMHNTSGQGSAEDGYVLWVYDENDIPFGLVDIQDGYLRVGLSLTGKSHSYGTSAPAAHPSFSDEWAIKVEHGANLVMELYLGGALEASHTITNTGSAIGKSARIRFIASDLAGSWFFSEFIVADHDCRGARLNMLSPVAAGNHTDFSGDVADLADNDYVTGMMATAAAQRQSMTVGAYSGVGTIAAVMACGTAASRDSNITQLTPFVRIGSTDYDGSASTMEDALGFITYSWDVNPADSLVWESADLTGIELGFLSVA